MDPIERIAFNNLTTLMKKGFDGNFLHISERDYIMQITLATNKTKMYLLAVSNTHLLENDRLSDEKIKQVETLGLKYDTKSKDYELESGTKPEDIAKLAQIISKTMLIYGVKPPKVEYELELEND